jgi:hypothetical protein
MAVALKIGKKLISPKRAIDRKGKEGVFLTEREWKAILIELKIKTAATKTENLVSGTLLALEEVDLYFQGKKKLRNANEAISDL